MMYSGVRGSSNTVFASILARFRALGFRSNLVGLSAESLVVVCMIVMLCILVGILLELMLQCAIGTCSKAAYFSLFPPHTCGNGYTYEQMDALALC